MIFFVASTIDNALSLWCSGGTENQEAEEEFHRTAQASWVQRMFTSLFSDSALFNTREGRAGKVHF